MTNKANEQEQAGILLNKGDIACLLAAASEVIGGLANNFYDVSLDYIYEGCRTLEERQAAAARYFENIFEVTAGAIHLTQAVFQKIYEEIDYIELKPHKH